ncbi:phosphoribosylglycinamide formyltransferase [bacterium C-53]|nr:phosphoribosylglycinamide formyltransferase [Lachnospiraceae bacterium]NBI04392.1 phosphoribosylglycinamide formyltransferase [Lachnospiraceae bacterium]RKJ08288.1 phosphoribosylglycinamide formyltransferase [bacterium C-53]
MLRVGILAAGGGTNLQAIIDAVEAGAVTNVQLAAVISNKPGVKALERARAHGIKDICVDMKEYKDRPEFECALTAAVEKENLDLLVLAGFMIMIPEELVHKYNNRIINVHPALIPSFCGKGFYGLKVHEAVLEKGVRVTGATVHFVDEVYDNGPIILQKAVEVKNGDTPEILQRRVMEEAEWQILPRAIHLIANGKVRVEGSKTRIEE